MSDVDPRLVRALSGQLARRPAGAARVGWKAGGGERERICGELAVGSLTSATTLADGAVYAAGGLELSADVEVAVTIGPGYAVDGYGVALEINDLAGGDDAEEIVAANVFHRAVAFGPFSRESPDDAEATLAVNGERRAAGRVADVAGTLDGVARVLASVGERLEPGDRVITGLVANAPVASGDEVVAEIGSLGRVSLRIA